ncbi:MAG: GNAT family N-acetyltransferase [Cyanobacteriota/Melainabacteria group bacterium]
MPEPNIRRATKDDARSILETHYLAVHETAAADYPGEILDEWSATVDEDSFILEKFSDNKEGELIYVAEIAGKIAAFGAIVPANNELRAVYVSPRFARQAIGSKLLVHLEAEAARYKMTELNLDSSLTAERFYLANGYLIKERGQHRLRSGRMMQCVHMYKLL